MPQFYNHSDNNKKHICSRIVRLYFPILLSSLYKRDLDQEIELFIIEVETKGRVFPKIGKPQSKQKSYGGGMIRGGNGARKMDINTFSRGFFSRLHDMCKRYGIKRVNRSYRNDLLLYDISNSEE